MVAPGVVAWGGKDVTASYSVFWGFTPMGRGSKQSRNPTMPDAPVSTSQEAGPIIRIIISKRNTAFMMNCVLSMHWPGI